MAPPRKHEVGKRYGRLVIVCIFPAKPANRTQVLVHCDCGNEKTVLLCNLVRGTYSCGCFRREYFYKHGHSKGFAPNNGKPSITYRTWANMMYRCYNDNDIRWEIYGGRGIKVCKRWHDFRNFLVDMGERPVGLTIDRINTNGHYESINCRWATPKEQCETRNRRRWKHKPKTDVGGDGS